MRGPREDPQVRRVGAAALIALVAIVVGIVVANFDPHHDKLQPVGLVKDGYDRVLAIDGPIQLALFPRIGAAVSGMTLSEHASSQPRIINNSQKEHAE